MKKTPKREAATNRADYWVLRKDQVRCLTSPTRHDIIDRLAAQGPLSVRDLAHGIGMRPSAVYHHLAQLLEVDLVVEAGSRIVNRRRERLYGTPSRRMRLIRALGEPKLKPLMKKTVSAVCRQMDRDFSKGAASSLAVTTGSARNHGFFRSVGQPGKQALARINALLGDIAEILWTERRAGAPLLAFAWTLTPVRGAGGRGRKKLSKGKP